MFTDEFKRYFIIITTVVLIGVIIYFSATNKVSNTENALSFVTVPVQKALSGVGNWFKRQGGFIVTIANTKKVNEELVIANEKLQLENNLYKKYKDENDELRALLDMKKDASYSFMVGASIIGVDPGNVNKVIIIDKGTRDGIEKNMIAIHYTGLVGRVLEAGYNHSKIITIVDDRMTIGSEVDRTKLDLIVTGDNVNGSNKCRIENIDISADLLEGDDVVTSNTSTLYPAGLIVGKIDNISSAGHDLTKTATLETSVDFEKIKNVILIKNKEMLQEE